MHEGGHEGKPSGNFYWLDAIFKAAEHGTMIFVQMYFESGPPRLRIYSLFVPGVSKTVLTLTFML